MNIIKNNLEKKTSFILKIIKISFIAFTSIFLILNFIPFYYGADSYLYGTATVRIADGNYEYTNELLNQTGNDLFLPGGWTKTNFNTAVPTSSVGIFGFSSISYLIAGYYGLFYLGPIFAILLVIISERITTKLFGEIAGFVTLIIVGTDSMILSVGSALLTDNIFSLFFILGSFYLIKFFQTKKESIIFLSSIFFVVATFVRINGVIVFPIEMVILGFFAIKLIKNEKNTSKFLSRDTLKLIIFKIKSPKFYKYGGLILLPWLVFFIFWFSFNDYYFGDPAANYQEPNITEFTSGYGSVVISSDQNRLEWIKFYSVGLLPDFFQSNLFEMTESDVNSSVYRNLAFIIASTILVSALVVSFFDRKKRTEVFVLTILAVGMLLFYSARLDDPSQSIYATEGIQTRYMLSSFILSTMILGYLINWILKTLPEKVSKNHSRKFPRIVHGAILGIVILFLFFSFYDDSRPVKALIDSNYLVNDPVEFASRYPVNSTGLSENDIVLWGGHQSLEYGLIPLSPKIPKAFHEEWDTSLIPQEPIDAIKKLDKDGYNIYTFNEDVSDSQRRYYQYLVNEHGILLQYYSNSFCQVKVVGIENIEKDPSLIPDGGCYWTPKTVKVLLSPEDPK